MPQQVEKVGWEGSEGDALVGNTSLLLQNSVHMALESVAAGMTVIVATDALL